MTGASETALLTTGGRSMKAHMALQQAQALVKGYLENLSAARACALAASSVRFLGDAFVSSELRRLLATAAIASTAARNAASLAFDGEFMPLTLRTNCNEAARISSSVAGGSKLKSVLMFLHISVEDPSLLQRSHSSILFSLIVGGRTVDSYKSQSVLIQKSNRPMFAQSVAPG